MSPENRIGYPFYELGEVDSSNNYAIGRIQAQMAEHGATFFAAYQSAGKGQRGKAWKAESGQNLMMSIVLEPHFLSVDNQFLLNVAIALSCYTLFNKHAIDKTGIKWPNDIYWGDRKAGGILIENILQGKDWKYCIAGIGININQTLFPPELPNPVSLKQITGKDSNAIALAHELCTYLEENWQKLKSGKFDQLLDEYNQILYKAGEAVTFKKDNAVFSAVVSHVNSAGELIVDTSELTAIPFGSVEWVLK